MRVKKVMPWFVFVAIKKEEVQAKKELIKGTKIVIPDTLLDTDSNYNVQCGVVIQIGEHLMRTWEKRGLPGLDIGDTLIFHHGIERDKEHYLIDEDETFYYYVIDNDGHNILGWEKPDGTLIPDYNHLWCRDLKEEDVVSESGIIVLNSFNTTKSMRDRLVEIDDQIKYVSDSAGDVNTVVSGLKMEAEKITSLLNKKCIHRLILQKINENILSQFSNITSGDIILVEGWPEYKGYPLKYKNEEYLIVKSSIVAAAIRSEYIVYAD